MISTDLSSFNDVIKQSTPCGTTKGRIKLSKERICHTSRECKVSLIMTQDPSCHKVSVNDLNWNQRDLRYENDRSKDIITEYMDNSILQITLLSLISRLF